MADSVEYPERILPKGDYISEIDLVKLLSEYEFAAIVRRSSYKKHDDTFDELGFLKEGAFVESLKELPGVSCNLLCGEFQHPDIKWKQDGLAKKNWDGAHRTVKDFGLEDFSDLGEENVAIIIPLENLLNAIFQYEKVVKNNSDLKKAIEKEQSYVERVSKKETIEIPKNKKTETGEMIATKIIKEIDVDTYTFDGGVLVKHVPTNGNYWHVELHLTNDKEKQNIINPIKSYNKGLSEGDQQITTLAGLRFIQTIESSTIKIEDFNCDPIPGHHYKKAV